jgi:nucleoside-diphosphate-sugar epimerase
MNKLVIFGGSGFVGTRLINRINQEEVDNLKIVDIACSKDYSQFYSFGDIRNLDSFSHLVPEGAILINLAAEHRDDVYPKSLYDQVNVHGAHNLCKIATEKKIKKIIFTSSVAVYGFALLGTDESGEIHPFNDYGRTKWEAEQVYKKWQLEDPENRTLVIVRPTVIFGERNRGNVFNLLKQIASGKFVMIGNGFNRKSMAYVENVAAFLEYSLNFKPGIHLYNYIDKPDFTMNQLVTHVNMLLNRSEEIKIRLPYWLGFAIGKLYDVVAFLTKKKFAISSIRVKKFCANSVYESAIDKTGFLPPVPLMEAIEKTVRYEFIEDHNSEQVFYTE